MSIKGCAFNARPEQPAPPCPTAGNTSDVRGRRRYCRRRRAAEGPGPLVRRREDGQWLTTVAWFRKWTRGVSLEPIPLRETGLAEVPFPGKGVGKTDALALI